MVNWDHAQLKGTRKLGSKFKLYSIQECTYHGTVVFSLTIAKYKAWKRIENYLCVLKLVSHVHSKIGNKKQQKLCKQVLSLLLCFRVRYKSSSQLFNSNRCLLQTNLLQGYILNQQLLKFAHKMCVHRDVYCQQCYLRISPSVTLLLPFLQRVFSIKSINE